METFSNKTDRMLLHHLYQVDQKLLGQKAYRGKQETPIASKKGTHFLEGNWENGGEEKTKKKKEAGEKAVCSIQKTKGNDVKHFKIDQTDIFRERI